MQRKQYSGDFKAKVALEAIKGLKTLNELASQYELSGAENFLSLFRANVLQAQTTYFR